MDAVLGETMHMRSHVRGLGRSDDEVRLRVQGGHPDVLFIDKAVTTIGRLACSDVVISHERVSRKHARIDREGGSYVLRDCGSRCGTFVNGRRVVEHVLAPGDRIALGAADRVHVTFDRETPTRTSAANSDVVDFTQVVAVLDILKAIGSGRLVDEVLALVIDAALATSAASVGSSCCETRRGS